MKKLVLLLTIITLMAGMSLPALADVQEWKVSDPFCDDAQEITFPVTMELMPWARIEFAGEFDFKEVGFCNISGYRLFWIDGGAFLGHGGGAREAYLPDESGDRWNSVVDEIHVNKAAHEANTEVNPRVIIATNAKIDVTFEFGDIDEWVNELPFYVPIYRKNEYDAGSAKYVAQFGRNVWQNKEGTTLFPDSATLTIDPATKLEFHLAGGILFHEDTFWRYEAGEYKTTITAT